MQCSSSLPSSSLFSSFSESLWLIWSNWDLSTFDEPMVKVAGGELGGVGRTFSGLWSWKICEFAKTCTISGAKLTFATWISRFTSFSWTLELKARMWWEIIAIAFCAPNSPVNGNVPLQARRLRRNWLIVIFHCRLAERGVSILSLIVVLFGIVVGCMKGREAEKVWISRSNASQTER